MFLPLLTLVPTLLYLIFFAVLAYYIYQMVEKYLTQQHNLRALDNQQQHNLRTVELQQERLKATLPLRLQAYERLLLLCERISIPNLVGRLRTEGASANDLRMAMLMAINQEFEHNVTQQIYVSENLWKIILMARDNTANSLEIVAQKLDKTATAEQFIGGLGAFLTEQSAADSIGMAQAAIRQEAASLVV